ncbi:MAG: gamma-glutamylcyclotransferase, partial [Ruthenibacterium sp.]
QLPIKCIKSGRIRTRDCFVYIMHEERSIGMPSLAYVSVCLEGYISFGFDEHFLSEAQIKSEEVVKDGKSRNHRN